MNEGFGGFMQKMQTFFPDSKDECTKSIDKYGEILETVMIEDMFAPRIVKLLDKNENKKLLEEVFDYLEEIFNSNQLDLICVCSVTILEILGNNRELLARAKKYMGPKTLLLQEKADRALGRALHNNLPSKI